GNAASLRRTINQTPTTPRTRLAWSSGEAVVRPTQMSLRKVFKRRNPKRETAKRQRNLGVRRHDAAFDGEPRLAAPHKPARIQRGPRHCPQPNGPRHRDL